MSKYIFDRYTVGKTYTKVLYYVKKSKKLIHAGIELRTLRLPWSPWVIEVMGSNHVSVYIDSRQLHIG